MRAEFVGACLLLSGTHCLVWLHQAHLQHQHRTVNGAANFLSFDAPKQK